MTVVQRMFRICVMCAIFWWLRRCADAVTSFFDWGLNVKTHVKVSIDEFFCVVDRWVRGVPPSTMLTTWGSEGSEKCVVVTCISVLPPVRNRLFEVINFLGQVTVIAQIIMRLFIWGEINPCWIWIKSEWITLRILYEEEVKSLVSFQTWDCWLKSCKYTYVFSVWYFFLLSKMTCAVVSNLTVRFPLR